jgi:hypothetical protein
MIIYPRQATTEQLCYAINSDKFDRASSELKQQILIELIARLIALKKNNSSRGLHSVAGGV